MLSQKLKQKTKNKNKSQQLQNDNGIQNKLYVNEKHFCEKGGNFSLT